MIKGTNEIKFNEETMIEIVQHYLNTVMLNPTFNDIKVTSVDYTNYTFKVTFEGINKDETTKQDR